MFLVIFPAFAFGQVVKTAAVPYTKGSGYTPNIAGSSELRVDTATSQLYWWSRDDLTWMVFRPGIDILVGSAAPSYTPVDNMSLFAINDIDSLYYYNGSTWNHINAGGGGADGNGIYDGSGNVPDGTTATLDDDFAFSGGDISSFTLTTGTSQGGEIFSNLSGATITHRDTSGSSSLEFTGTGANFNFTDGSTDRLKITGRDARYAADYSGTFSARSLVDKGYVDGAVSGEVSIPDGEIAFGNATSDGITSSSALTFDGDALTNQLISLEGSSGTITGKDGAFQDLGASSSTSGGAITIGNYDGAAMSNTHRMGVLQFGANTGVSGTGVGASIQAFAAANWSGTSSAGELRISTTPSGTLTEKERLRITRSGTAQLRNGTALDFLNASDAEVIEFSVADSALYIYGLGSDSEGEVVFQTKIGLYNLYNVALTGNKNNMFIGGGNIIEVGSDGAYDITGAIGGMRQGGSRLMFAKNVSNFVLTIKDESASSSAANRFDLDGSDYEWQPNEMLIWVYFDADDRWNILNKSGGSPGATDHGALTGLSDDDHAQYALLAGRATGQTLIGGTAANDDLTLNSTSNATKGDVFIQTAGGNVTIGGGTAASEVRILEPSGSGSNYTAIRAQAQGTDITYTLPPDDGDAGEFLKTNGSGSLTWEAATASETNAPPTLYPSQITATQNDYSPTGYSTTISQTIQVDGDGSFRTITGFAAATRDGVKKTFYNDGTNCYIIAKQHTGSSSGNRVNVSQDVVMLPGMSATFRYDSVGAAWVMESSTRERISYGNMIETNYLGNSGTITSADNPNFNWTTNGGAFSANAASSSTIMLRRFSAANNSTSNGFPTVSTKGDFVYLNANTSYIRLFARISVNTLSTAAEDYDVRLGFKAGTVDTTITEGAYISYQREENSGGFTLKTHDGATLNTVNAGSPIVADTYYSIELIYYPYGEVTAFVNGARYTTTSNLPTALAVTGFGQLDTDNGTGLKALRFSALEFTAINVTE